MTEYRISDDFRKDGLDKADATPNSGVDLGELNRADLARRIMQDLPQDHVPIEEGGTCTKVPCLECFPIDGMTG